MPHIPQQRMSFSGTIPSELRLYPKPADKPDKSAQENPFLEQIHGKTVSLFNHHIPAERVADVLFGKDTIDFDQTQGMQSKKS